MDDITKFLESQDITKSYQTISDKNWNDVTIESLLIAYKEHLKINVDLGSVRLSLPPDGFDILKYRTPRDGQMCDCITEIGRTFTAKYLKFKSFDSGVFVNDDLDEGYRDKVIYWKGNEA